MYQQRQQRRAVPISWTPGAAMAAAIGTMVDKTIGIEHSLLYQALHNKNIFVIRLHLNALLFCADKENIKKFLTDFKDEDEQNIIDFALQTKNPRIIIFVLDFFKKYAPKLYETTKNKYTPEKDFCFELSPLL